jgi:hypothetical protein
LKAAPQSISTFTLFFKSMFRNHVLRKTLLIPRALSLCTRNLTELKLSS